MSFDSDPFYSPATAYDTVISSQNHPNHYTFTHTKWFNPPVTNCKYVKSIPCPNGKTSYWRGFATDLKEGGCGEPKKICGASKFPKLGPPRYVVEPATKADLIKFLYNPNFVSNRRTIPDNEYPLSHSN